MSVRWILCALFLLIPTTSTYRILLMCPFPAPSHWLWVEKFARGFLERGHHVTAVTNFKTKEPHPNYTEILIQPSFDIPAYFPKEEIFKMRFNSEFQNLFMWWKVGLLTSEHALNDTKVKRLIASENLHFDLFVLEQFFHESFLMFAHKFKVPTITVGTFGYADNMDRSMGLLTPWSFVPHIVLPYSDEMTFLQRAYNTLLSLFDFTLRRLYYIPRMQEMAVRHFKGIAGKNELLPSVLDLEKNISMMFINSHRSIDRPRPSMPGLLNVGGIHIKPPKALPSDIQSFLDGAKEGAIYFSLGSYMKSTEMPQQKFLIIMEAFRRLKQRVLWKYEDESIKNLPPNVMVKKWLPQSDILAHKNIILFITHGGIFGTQEGLYHGVPMLYMPLYGDQHRNSIKSVQAGYALSLDFSKLDSDTMYIKIQKMIEDKSFSKRAKELSILFRDNLVNPLDEAMFWAEYVMRHKGAKHLKSAAVHIPWYQYVLLDVFLLYAAVLLAVIYILYKIISLILSFVSFPNLNSDKKNN